MYTNISFKCVSCDTDLVKNIAIPDINMNDNDEALDIQVVDCNICRRCYEVEIMNRSGSLDVLIAGIKQNNIYLSTPEIEPEFIEPFQDWRIDYEWYSDISQKTVFQYFTVSMENIRDMLTLKLKDKNQAEMLNRMLLVQCISGLEAYLSDTLITRICSCHWLLEKLYSIDPQLKNEKRFISEYLKDNDLPLKRAKSYLEELMYHNIPKIQFLYHSVLNVNFDYGGERNRKLLFTAIHERHDFVHRNGKTKEDGSLRLIDKKYISDVLTMIEEFVFQIEKT